MAALPKALAIQIRQGCRCRVHPDAGAVKSTRAPMLAHRGLALGPAGARNVGTPHVQRVGSTPASPIAIANEHWHIAKMPDRFMQPDSAPA